MSRLSVTAVWAMGSIEVFINSPQYKNANITYLVLAVPLETKWTNEVCNLEMYKHHMVQIKKKTADI